MAFDRLPKDDHRWSCRVRGCKRVLWSRIPPECPDHGLRMRRAD